MWRDFFAVFGTRKPLPSVIKAKWFIRRSIALASRNGDPRRLSSGFPRTHEVSFSANDCSMSVSNKVQSKMLAADTDCSSPSASKSACRASTGSLAVCEHQDFRSLANDLASHPFEVRQRETKFWLPSRSNLRRASSRLIRRSQGCDRRGRGALRALHARVASSSGGAAFR